MSLDHDSSYKYLFSAPEMVRDLIMGFVPDEWLHSLDYATLERVDGSYITEDFKSRADDIVWRIKVGGEWAYLYLLIEFQSTVDKYMALRMMVYQGLLYQDLIKQGLVLSDGRLPPVLPIVLYNGSQRWTAVRDVFDLIPPVPGLVEQFKPRAKYLLVDENDYPDSELTPLKNLVAAIFRFEHPVSSEKIEELIALLEVWLVDQPDLRKMIARWLRATLMRKPEYRILSGNIRRPSISENCASARVNCRVVQDSWSLTGLNCTRQSCWLIGIYVKPTSILIRSIL